MTQANTLPDVWGTGMILAFSGLDGETSWAQPFALTGEEPMAFRVHGLETGFRLAFSAGEGIAPRIDWATGDVVDASFPAESGAIRVLLVWRDRRTLAGRAEATGTGVLSASVNGGWTWDAGADYGVLARRSADFHLSVTSGAVEAETGQTESHLRFRCAPGTAFTFALTLGGAADPNDDDVPALVAQRQRFARELNVPRPEAPGLDWTPLMEKTYRKAATVMKVNCMSPESQIRRGWTTPDRVPHRHMWIWDSAFHAQGWKYFDAQWAKDAVLAVFDKQRDDGFIPHTMSPDGTKDSRMIQPPILAWAAWDIYQQHGGEDFLRDVLGPNVRFLEWITANMDVDGNGLCEWKKGGAESGMDNSPRFEFGEPFDAVDLNCFIVNDYAISAAIAGALGDTAAAETYRARAESLAGRIREHLWDPERGFFLDRRNDGALIPVESPCAFMALFAGVASPEQAEALVAALRDPRRFGSAMPLPSIGLGDPTYEKDMWRGPTWINYNYLAIRGLARYGYREDAARVARRTLEEIARWYETNGVIYEFYDAEAEVAPSLLNRKGKRGGHWLHIVIPDYHWSAALYVALAHELTGIAAGG